MRFQWHWLLLFSIVFLPGCSGDSMHPTTSSGITARDGQPFQQLTDDTTGSDIMTTPYTPHVIAAVGDSITYGEGGSRHLGGYPGILETKMQSMGYPIDTYNTGIPGATSADLIPSFRRNITGADIVLLMAGTNDILNPLACVDAVDCRIADNIRTMLNIAIQMGVKPVIGTITPKNPHDTYSFLNPRIQHVNGVLATVAEEYQIAIVDTYTAILNNGGAALYYDKHHFTDAGYTVLAEAWYQVLTHSVLYPIPGSQ